MEKVKCPQCGSMKLIRVGFRLIHDKRTKSAKKLQKWQCKSCGIITTLPSPVIHRSKRNPKK